MGVHYVTLKQARKRGVNVVVREALAHLEQQVDTIYLTVDMDVLDIGVGPGAPAATPGGMRTDELFEAVRIAGTHPQVKAMDLVCLDPLRDVREATVKAGVHVMLSFLTGRNPENHSLRGGKSPPPFFKRHQEEEPIMGKPESQPHYQTTTSFPVKNIAKLILFSAIGIFMFFVPMTVGDTSSIPLDHVVTWLQKSLGPLVPWYALVIILPGALVSLYHRELEKESGRPHLLPVQDPGIGNRHPPPHPNRPCLVVCSRHRPLSV